jgi:hypothetical protein
MKHVMEHATGKYVTNGEFIAAALIAGCTFSNPSITRERTGVTEIGFRGDGLKESGAVKWGEFPDQRVRVECLHPAPTGNADPV